MGRVGGVFDFHAAFIKSSLKMRGLKGDRTRHIVQEHLCDLAKFDTIGMAMTYILMANLKSKSSSSGFEI